MNLRKRSIEEITHEPKAIKETPKKRRVSFTANQSISNRRLSAFSHFSNQTKDEMNGIMLSINSICNSMCFGSKNEGAVKAISSNAKAQTRRLSKTIEKIKAVNNTFNQDYFTGAYPDGLRNRVNLLKKKATIKETDDNNSFSLSEISTANFKAEGNEREEEDITARLKQMTQLHRLKGEIRLMDQRKKYSVKKTFEKTKVYYKQHFFRKEKDTIKYKPYRQYNKENLYYGRNDNANAHKNYSTYQNTITDLSNINKNQGITSNRPFFPYKLNKRYNIITTRSDKVNSYHNPRTDFQSLTTGTNTSKDNTHNITDSHKPASSSITQSKIKKKEAKPRLSLIKSINNKALQESDKLNEAISTLFINEKPKKKINRDTISLKRIRKEFRLDSLDNRIDENKILWENASKVMRNLDKQSQILLCQVVKEMIYKDDLLNRKYYDESSYTQKLESINEKKEFQKVVDEMMALKKEIKAEKAIVPVNEKEKLFKMITQIEEKEWTDEDCLKKLMKKAHLMLTIKPLLNNNKTILNQKKKKQKEKANFDF